MRLLPRSRLRAGCDTDHQTESWVYDTDQFVDEVAAEVESLEFDEARQRRRQVLDEVLTQLQRLQVGQADHTHTHTHTYTHVQTETIARCSCKSSVVAVWLH